MYYAPILENLLQFSHSKEEHIHHLCLVFEFLHTHKLYAKESKREFFKEQVYYLGHIITRDGLMIDPAKVEAIMNWPHPTNMIELQVFLRLANFCCNIQDYTKLMVPMMNQLHNEGQTF